MDEKVVKNDKKDALLEDAIKQIEKQYGKGSIMKLGERAAVDVDAISSGSIKIDEALYRQAQQAVSCYRRSAGHRRLSKGPYHRDLWSGIQR